MCPKVKRLLSTFISILSIVNVFFLPEWINFFGEHSSDSIFRTPTPFHNAYFALAFTVFGVAVLITAVIPLGEKLNLKKLNILIHLLMVCSLVITLNFLREAIGLFYLFPQLSKIASYWVYHFIIPYKYPLILALAITVFVIVQKLDEHIISGVRIFGLVISPLLFVCYGNLAFSYWKSVKFDPEPKIFSRNSPRPKVDAPKVVWVIFDELDYRLLFDQRPEGLKLPELERLKSESIFFTKAYPPSDRTIHSIPSLLSGARWNVVEVSDSDLKIKGNVNNPPNLKLTDIPNIFGLVKKMGYTTGLLGWYHNYCRIFKHDLDYCRRVPAGRFGYAENFWDSVGSIFDRSLNFDKRVERAYVYNLNQLISRASKKIKYGRYSFLFVHLSIPHAPWIYDETHDTLSTQVSKEPSKYFANVKLVDKTLGQLRKSMEESGDWNNATLIVSSDHSWRESSNYDGKRDFRVPYFVKMPDCKGAVMAQPTATVLTKEFILQIMSKGIRTTREAVSWFDINNNDFPVGSVLVPIETDPMKNPISKISPSEESKS